MRIWRRARGAWWGPYLGVLLWAAVCALVVLAFVIANSAEISRVLRATGV